MTALRTPIIAICLVLLSAVSVLAGPPLVTDDAGTVDLGKVEIELNGSSPYDKETTFGVSTRRNASDAEIKISTGLYKNLGISLTVPYTISGRIKDNDQPVSKTAGLGDMNVELKFAFVELAGIYFAVKPSVILPTGRYSAGLSEGRWQFGSTLIATKEVDEGKYALHANLGYEHHFYRSDEAKESSRSNLLSCSIAGEAEVYKGLFVVADLGLATNQDRVSDDLPVYVLTGLRYKTSDHLDINAGVKLSLTKPEDDVTVMYGLAL